MGVERAPSVAAAAGVGAGVTSGGERFRAFRDAALADAFRGHTSLARRLANLAK